MHDGTDSSSVRSADQHRRPVATDGAFSAHELRWVMGGLLAAVVVIVVSGHVAGFGSAEEELPPPYASPARFAGGQTWTALTAAYVEQVDGEVLRVTADRSSATATTYLEGARLQWIWRDGQWVEESREPALAPDTDSGSRGVFPSEYSLDRAIQKTSDSTNIASDAEVEVVVTNTVPFMLTLDDGSSRGTVAFEEMP